MDWKDRPPGRKNRPGIDDLRAYFAPEVMALFETFSERLSRVYGLRCAPAVYTAQRGWTFQFGRSGMYPFKGIYLMDGCFFVEGIRVRDEGTLGAALDAVVGRMVNGAAEELAAHAAQHSAEQTARAKARRERERAELEALTASIDRARFNRYRWSPKLSRQKLRLLYERDADRMDDEELADEIGITLYARCMQGRDERILIESGRLRCHECGEILTYKGDLMECTCGSLYLFRDYMRSFRTNNMPSGAATRIFNDFIENWPRAASYVEKMRLIDGLIHEFHINLVTGVKGRFVAVNLIEGTKKQIADLILSLAYGDAQAQAVKEAFERNLRG